MLSHGAVASRYLGEDVVYEAFADWTTARVRPEVKAVLGILAKLTRRPRQIEAEDMLSLLEAGVPEAGIEQAIMIGGFIFNYQNRMADALGADIPKDKLRRAGAMLNLEGRRMLKDRLVDGEMQTYNGVIPPEVDAMINSICSGPGETEKTLRQAVFRRGLAFLGFPETGTDIPQNLTRYIDTISRHAPEVTDEDIKALLRAGWTEAGIFEVTVVSSAAAGYGRLKIAWEALAAAKKELGNVSR